MRHSYFGKIIKQSTIFGIFEKLHNRNCSTERNRWDGWDGHPLLSGQHTLYFFNLLPSVCYSSNIRINFQNLKFRSYIQNHQIMILQLTFSKKGTKMAPQTHILKFEILEILSWHPFNNADFPLD